MIEKVFIHETNIALQLVGLHGKIFVEIEGDDIGQRQVFFLMHTHQFIVNADGGTPSRQTEDTVLAGFRFAPRGVRDVPGDGDRGITGLRKYLAGNFFKFIASCVDGGASFSCETHSIFFLQCKKSTEKLVSSKAFESIEPRFRRRHAGPVRGMLPRRENLESHPLLTRRKRF